MGLEPCAYSMTFNVTREEGGGAEGRGGKGRFRLNGILNQRSQDILAANNWNVVQYAVLIHMLAQVSDMVRESLSMLFPMPTYMTGMWISSGK